MCRIFFVWMKPLGCALVLALLAACGSQERVAEEPRIAWNLDLEYPIRFQRIVDAGLMVVGTARHLHGIDPASGATRWRARNIRALSDDVLVVPDAPYLLVMDSGGGGFDDQDTHVLAIARHDGRVYWESPRIRGKVLQAIVDPDSERMYAVTVRKAHGDDHGMLSDLLPGKGIGAGLEREPQLLALDLRRGAILWTRLFGEHVPMRPAAARQLDENGEWQEQRAFDLGLYREPFLAGRQVCVSYTGVSCFSTVDGAPAWRNEFAVNDGDLALSYSPALAGGDTIYMSGNGRLRALHAASGRMLWTSPQSDAIPDVQESGNTLFLQLGGRFFDIEDEAWQWHGEFGLMAVDKRSGERLWKYDGGDGSITNVLLFSGFAWLADEDDLIVLAQQSGKVVERVAHGFAEPPVFAALNDNGQLVLVNESEAGAIDTRTFERLWHVRFTPPGPGAWARFSAGLLQFSGNVLRFTSTVVAYTSGLVPSVPVIPVASGVSVRLVSSRRIVGGLTGRTGRRMSYQPDAAGEVRHVAQLSGAYQYFVTRMEDGERPALAMVELNSGRTERLIALPHADPNLLIDDNTASLFQIEGRQLTAVRMRPGMQLGAR